MRALDVVVSRRAPYLGRFSWESPRDFEEAERALSLCDAAHLRDRYLDEMSGGERKRVFLARVPAGTPRLIVLDLSHVQQFSKLLRDVVDQTGGTVLFAAHDLNWAAAHSDRMLVLQRGTLALDAPPPEVMRADVMRSLFGFEAETVTAGGRTWIVPPSKKSRSAVARPGGRAGATALVGRVAPRTSQSGGSHQPHPLNLETA